MSKWQFVIATRNKDKLIEIKSIFEDERWELISMFEFPDSDEIIENGNTFLENAFIKAFASFRLTGITSLGEDSGLEVDYLNGSPGIFSSRFAGEKGDYRDNNKKLLNLMKGVPREKRTAKFRCVVALADNDNKFWVEGNCNGIILPEYRGEQGFGYDPLFYVPDLDKTFAEMSLKQKRKVSHRGMAFRKMAALIEKDFIK
jgi:XTP/dITP diphosphohydrolase